MSKFRPKRQRRVNQTKMGKNVLKVGTLSFTHSINGIDLAEGLSCIRFCASLHGDTGEQVTILAPGANGLNKQDIAVHSAMCRSLCLALHLIPMPGSGRNPLNIC